VPSVYLTLYQSECIFAALNGRFQGKRPVIVRQFNEPSGY
jgi:hypothetical protein